MLSLQRLKQITNYPTMITSKTIAVNPGSATQPPLSRGSQWLRNIHPAPLLLDEEISQQAAPERHIPRSQATRTILRMITGAAFIVGAVMQLNGQTFFFGSADYLTLSAWCMAILGAMLFIGLGGRIVPLLMMSGCILPLVLHSAVPTPTPFTASMTIGLAGAMVAAIFVFAGMGRKSLDRFISKVIIWKVFS